MKLLLYQNWYTNDSPKNTKPKQEPLLILKYESPFNFIKDTFSNLIEILINLIVTKYINQKQIVYILFVEITLKIHLNEKKKSGFKFRNQSTSLLR